MNLIDTHAHLYWESYQNDFDEMIQRAVDAGISAIVNIGIDIEKSQVALKQTQDKLADIPGLLVYSTIGIHPHEALKFTPLTQDTSSQNKSSVDIAIQKDIEKLEQIYLSCPEKVIAVGECGLDYFFNPSFTKGSRNKPFPIPQIKILQKKLFQAQIDLAKKLNLPLIVHCRDDRSKNQNHIEAWDEILKLIGNHPTILHCYSGLLPTTQKAIQKASVLVSFAANITYPKNEYLRKAVEILPLNKIILETDAPFLAPQSARGQRNEPSSVKGVAQLIADLKGVSLEKVANQTTTNAVSFLSLNR
ncbi:TatD family hydrolase [Patescibacteria group bacterium]|nr:TatD family hydrolase [Patescibacteria group bacterium]